MVGLEDAWYFYNLYLMIFNLNTGMFSTLKMALILLDMSVE